MTGAIRVLFAVLVCPASAAAADPLNEAFHRMYNLDFAGAHKVLDTYLAAHPSDPLPHAARASAYLFHELDRLKILEGEFFSDDKKISGDDKLDPDPDIRAKLFASVDTAQRLAEARLQAKPNDSDALFSYCITEGLRTDYTAFVEKKQLRSLSSAKKAHNYAVQLLQADPTFVDAYLTTGLTEYMVGSLPFFIRWFVKFEQTQGSKEQAVVNLEKVSSSGRYLGPFARILLAIIHIREKRLAKSMDILQGLTAEFPGNPLFRRELDKLKKKVVRPR